MALVFSEKYEMKLPAEIWAKRMGCGDLRNNMKYGNVWEEIRET